MIVNTKDGAALAAGGLSSLRYFTILSNLFNGTISLIYAVRTANKIEISAAQKTWKLAAVTSVGVTFVTVMCFLGPIYGYDKMFRGANFWLHFVLPVASICSFVFLERDIKMPFPYTLWSIVPTILYASVYLINIALNGIGSGENRNDIYGFLNWGNAIGGLICIGIIAGTWVISICLYYLNGLKK